MKETSKADKERKEKKVRERDRERKSTWQLSKLIMSVVGFKLRYTNKLHRIWLFEVRLRSLLSGKSIRECEIRKKRKKRKNHLPRSEKIIKIQFKQISLAHFIWFPGGFPPFLSLSLSLTASLSLFVWFSLSPLAECVLRKRHLRRWQRASMAANATPTWLAPSSVTSVGGKQCEMSRAICHNCSACQPGTWVRQSKRGKEWEK